MKKKTEIATTTSHDTEKASLINYVIGNQTSSRSKKDLPDQSTK